VKFFPIISCGCDLQFLVSKSILIKVCLETLHHGA
jgi:hypothetical protein